MKSNEERTCQAERDYDAMREEQLLASADDHRDESEWFDFLENKVRYFSNAVLNKAIDDLIAERSDRTATKSKQWKGAVEAVEIDLALKGLMNKESIF